MKQLLITFFFFTSFISHAQWLEGEYIDDPGKPGETLLYQLVRGTLSNTITINTTMSSTTNSKCSFFLELCKDARFVAITIFPYVGNNASKRPEYWKESSSQVMQISSPSGGLTKIECFCADGRVLFVEENYNKLMETIKDRGKYMVSLIHKIDDSESLYKFSFVN